MSFQRRRVLVTGANGFIGKNLVVRLSEFDNISILKYVRGDETSSLNDLISKSDFVIHLAGENRPHVDEAYTIGNADLTMQLCNSIRKNYEDSGRYVPLIFASSVQATSGNPYGFSKLNAEMSVLELSGSTGNPSVIFRLPGIFGKWCKPNYNSVVATFCHNISRGLPINIHDPSSIVRLAYIDDVVTALISALDINHTGCINATLDTIYTVGLGDLANQLVSFKECRDSLMIEKVGLGLTRALYATYVSYLPTDNFSYKVQQHSDVRGRFVEVLKTSDSGQFSYFTAFPGVTRGSHYHHTKTEKFLVVKGCALFRFRHLITNELVELRTSGENPEVVDTIPGWSHDITNVGNEEMLVMLWANENFDIHNPDTVASKVA
jgi:UDP-2-acetamido-2,6-beta-L-arabino-hexul-4-ose reductase